MRTHDQTNRAILISALLAAVGGEAGLCRPIPESDPVHFELAGPGGCGGPGGGPAARPVLLPPPAH